MGQPIKLTLLTISPAHYHVPLYRKLAEDPRLEFTAVFASKDGLKSRGSVGQPETWDVDLLSGYNSYFLTDDAGCDRGLCHLPERLSVIRRLAALNTEVLWMHGYNHLEHQIAGWAQIVKRRPLLIREEQTLLDSRPVWKRGAKAIGLRAMLKNSYGLFIGSENKRWFDHYGVSSQRLSFVPYTVDNERFQSEAAQLSRVRSKLKAEIGLRPPSGPVILTLCRLVAKKQVHMLLDAFDAVRKEMQCTLVIAGTGPLESDLRDTVSNRGLEDVVFTGFVNQSHVSRLYSIADVFVLASGFNETWGLVVNEAMNFQLPIIVTDKVGSGFDLVQSGENGYVVDHESESEMISGLKRLVGDAELRRKFGARSVQRINEWTYEVAADGVREAIRRAVGPARWESAA